MKTLFCPDCGADAHFISGKHDGKESRMEYQCEKGHVFILCSQTAKHFEAVKQATPELRG
jgi:hypothetical protein